MTDTASLRTRAATPADASAIAAIYNEGIADRIATFETEPRSATDIAGWFTGEHLVVVAETGETGPVAFAASFPYSSRPCYRRWKSGRRGISQRIAKAGSADTWSSPRARARLCICRDTTARRSSAGPASASSSVPAWVGTALRLVRKKRRTPNQTSSRRICRLTAPWVTLSSSAARVKLPSRAAASKALIAFNGGRRERDTL